MKRIEWFMEVALGVGFAAILVGVISPCTAHAADVTIGMDVVSAYVFRGNTFNNGPVIQPSLTIGNLKIGEEMTLPLTLGVWGNMDIGTYDKTLDSRSFSEVDFTVSYALPEVIEKLGWSVGYVEYVYPGGADEDREANLCFSYDTFLSPSIAFNYGLAGVLDDNWYIEGALKHAFDLDPVTLTVGGSLAYQYMSAGANPGSTQGFGPLALTASATYKIVTASISYVAELDDDVIANYDVEVIGKLGVAYTF